MRGIGRGLSDHHVVLCKVRLVGARIKRRKMVDGARKIRCEKLREHQYTEGYARSLEEKGENNVEYMWEQVKRAMVESAKEVCGLLRVGGKNSNRMWWNDAVKTPVKRKKAALRKC